MWINPEPQGVWQYRQSISVVQQLVNQRMYPLTIKGLEGPPLNATLHFDKDFRKNGSIHSVEAVESTK